METLTTPTVRLSSIAWGSAAGVNAVNEAQTPPPPPPSTLSVMGPGTVINSISELEQYHTPTYLDKGYRSYHEHMNLTPHAEFAKAITEACKASGLILEDIAMKVDGVVKHETAQTEAAKDSTGWLSGYIKKYPRNNKEIANRFFLIARVKNHDYQVSPDIETFVIARNSHDKRIPMEFAIGNQVIVCSNLMFGGDITIKAKNSRYGVENFANRLHSLLVSYRHNIDETRENIEFLKECRITKEEGLSFIASHATEAAFIQPSRTANVCDMFIAPEHPLPYQDIVGNQKWTLWRLLNAYTYAHRGDLVIDPATKEPFPDLRRKGAANITNKKKFTAALWKRLMSCNTTNCARPCLSEGFKTWLRYDWYKPTRKA